jgi:hypothetical protein
VTADIWRNRPLTTTEAGFSCPLCRAAAGVRCGIVGTARTAQLPHLARVDSANGVASTARAGRGHMRRRRNPRQTGLGWPTGGWNPVVI